MSTIFEPILGPGLLSQVMEYEADEVLVGGADIASEASTYLMVPGIFAGGGIWKGTLDRLTRPARCVVLRRAFAGLDPAPATVADCVDSIRAVLDARDEEKVVLIGNSLGALVALEVAASRPGRVGGLVLSGAPGLGRGFNVPKIKRGNGTLDDDSIKEFLAWLFNDPANVPRALIEETRQLFEERNRTIIALLRQTRDKDIDGLLKKVRCPVLCLWGGEDRVTPAEPWEALARASRTMQFVTIPDSGHSPMIERPAMFARYVDDYVASVAR